MAHLRRIQQNTSFPLSIRHAAERLSAPITRQQAAPFTTNPVADSRLIITYLAGIHSVTTELFAPLHPGDQ